MNPEFLELPYDLDVEYSVIGCVLLQNGLMPRLANLTSNDFYSAQHADAWQAMQGISGQISPFTIKPLLKRPEIFGIEGPLKYLAMSIPIAGVYCDPIEGVEYLIRLSQQRQLAMTCRSVEGLSPMDAAIRLSEAANRVMNAAPLETFEDNYQVTAKIIDNLKDGREPYKTGIKTLDEAMGGGLYPSRSYGFAARKKMGKTLLAGTISHNLNIAGTKHLFICGEMSPEEIQQRVLSRITETYPSAFRGGYAKTEQFGKKLAEVAASMPRNVLYKNAPGMTFDELKATISSAIDRHAIKGVILDYWQLVGGKQKHQSTAEHLDDVAQWISDYSRKRGTWAIMMAQINQDGNTRGGEGIRLAFDQVYNLKAPEDDPSRSGRWLEMMETRYTAWMNIGTEMSPGLMLVEKGLYFSE